ncbi:sensor histidine kinase [Brevundimonas variabilis]|uniref:histidine kinase n=1 Tax=Brevundimonas variabilis TaxID=74312 RepID=A0A7W9CKY8_9CAUL|nr:ATP-binding protein [Brevundimonas variabilis]MBB5747466.1 two-component system sensor kinase FixL [Brevundimonas variabilis]
MTPLLPATANHPLLPRLARRRGLQAWLIALSLAVMALAPRIWIGTESHLFYLLPIIAVGLSATVTGRKPTFLVLAITTAANIWTSALPTDLPALALSMLFGVIAWLLAEVFWELGAYRRRTDQLSVHLDRRQVMLETILASVPVMTVTREGMIQMLTHPACQLFGTTQASVGKPVSAFIDGFDAIEESASVGPNDHVWTGRRENEITFPLNVQVGVLPEQPASDHLILCLTDLSLAHAADAHARDLHAQLNRVWRLNSLGEMAATLAHELNQPLSAATTYLHASQVDVARAGLMGESAGRTIELAKGQILRAGSIIRRMRELLAHQARSLGQERVGAMVADLAGVFSMIERAGGVQIQIQIDDVHDRVRADRIQFQQAMVNLVRNGVEALAGTADPQLRIVGRVLSDAEFQIVVEDNGIGIAAEKIDTIFRPLMTTKAGGMGLGLSVTRTIVESHGGVLQVEKSVLGGAAFSFCLMREQEMEPE